LLIKLKSKNCGKFTVYECVKMAKNLQPYNETATTPPLYESFTAGGPHKRHRRLLLVLFKGSDRIYWFRSDIADIEV